MRVERDVTGKANFVMWHARASGKLMVSYFSKLRAQSPWLWSDIGEANTYTPKYHKVTCLLEKALKLSPAMKNPECHSSFGTLPSSSPGESLCICASATSHVPCESDCSRDINQVMCWEIWKKWELPEMNKVKQRLLIVESNRWLLDNTYVVKTIVIGLKYQVCFSLDVCGFLFFFLISCLQVRKHD